MSKSFELHFNPKQPSPNKDNLWFRQISLFQKNRTEAIFDTFCFAPENKSEENLGCLYLVGELKDIPPKTSDLLSAVADIIKQEYYTPFIKNTFPQPTPDSAFKQGLQKANEFLARELQAENNQWLGNLSLGALVLTPNLSLYLSRTGNLKTLLLRDEEIFDIGKNVSQVTSGQKTFPSVVEGQLLNGDKLLILTEQVFDFFNQDWFLQNLSIIKKPKELKKLLKEKRKTFKHLQGACLMVLVKKERRKIYLPVASSSRIPFLSTASYKISQKITPQSSTLQSKLTKGILAFFFLIVLLLLGYLLF